MMHYTQNRFICISEDTWPYFSKLPFWKLKCANFDENIASCIEELFAGFDIENIKEV